MTRSAKTPALACLWLVALLGAAQLALWMSGCSGRDAAWLSNYEEAAAKAKAEKKPLVINFTGSDWCMWCIKLRKEVFSKPEFKKFAAENFVLLELDFPKSGAPDPKTRETNQRLFEKYRVNGFPTIIVIDPSGSELGRTGYIDGGVQPFLVELKKIARK